MLKLFVKNAKLLFWLQVVAAGLAAAAKASGKVDDTVLNYVLGVLGVTTSATGLIAPAPAKAQEIHDNA
jgi:hypothetical protein